MRLSLMNTALLHVTCNLRTIVYALPLRTGHRRLDSSVTAHSDIRPYGDLTWQPCYQNQGLNTTCANLIVPLDYTDSSIGTTTIALIRQPGTDSDGDDILVNPGGPGGAGVGYVLSKHDVLRDNVGFKHNLIGFDPRGVGASGIRLSCFDDDVSETMKASFQRARTQDVAGIDADDEEQVEKLWVAIETYGEQCNKAKKGSYARYAGTVAVAQDMLHYIKLRAGKLGEDPNNAKLNYYGISYGSVLGMTFASLFPEHVGRVVLDGVSDMHDWYAGGKYGHLRKMDAAVEEFFARCHAECSVCGLCREGDTPKDLKDRLDVLLAEMMEQRIPPSDNVPRQVGASPNDILEQFAPSLTYSDLTWPGVASDLDAWERREMGSLIYALEMERDEETLADRLDDGQARAMIAAVDAAGRTGIENVGDLQNFLREATRLSKYGGTTSKASENAMWYRRVNIVPPEGQVYNGLGDITNTTPMLFTTNRLDAVTPAAREMSAYFPGSVVLEQNSFGHTTQQVSSRCTSELKRGFLEDGVLPMHGTTCDPDTTFSFSSTYNVSD